MQLLHSPTTLSPLKCSYPSITNSLQHSPITPELCRKKGFRAYCVHTVLRDLHCEHGFTNTSKKTIQNTGQNFGRRKSDKPILRPTKISPRSTYTLPPVPSPGIAVLVMEPTTMMALNLQTNPRTGWLMPLRPSAHTLMPAFPALTSLDMMRSTTPTKIRTSHLPTKKSSTLPRW